MRIKIIKSTATSMPIGSVFDVHNGEHGQYIVSKYGTDEYLKYLPLAGVHFTFEEPEKP